MSQFHLLNEFLKRPAGPNFSFRFARFWTFAKDKVWNGFGLGKIASKPLVFRFRVKPNQLYCSITLVGDRLMQRHRDCIMGIVKFTNSKLTFITKLQGRKDIVSDRNKPKHKNKIKLIFESALLDFNYLFTHPSHSGFWPWLSNFKFFRGYPAAYYMHKSLQQYFFDHELFDTLNN